MTDVLLPLLIIVATVAATECLAWLVHKYLLHGPLWVLHRTHHGHSAKVWGWFEWNDLVVLPYALASAGLVVWGDLNQHWLRFVGVGIAVYGILYFLMHDVLVHQRVKWRIPVRGYLWRLVRAHKVHHKSLHRDGSEAFGFLYAPRKYGNPPAATRHR